MKENTIGLCIIGFIVAIISIPAFIICWHNATIAEKVAIAAIGLGSAAVTGIVALMRMGGGTDYSKEPSPQSTTTSTTSLQETVSSKPEDSYPLEAAKVPIPPGK